MRGAQERLVHPPTVGYGSPLLPLSARLELPRGNPRPIVVQTQTYRIPRCCYPSRSRRPRCSHPCTRRPIFAPWAGPEERRPQRRRGMELPRRCPPSPALRPEHPQPTTELACSSGPQSQRNGSVGRTWQEFRWRVVWCLLSPRRCSVSDLRDFFREDNVVQGE